MYNKIFVSVLALIFSANTFAAKVNLDCTIISSLKEKFSTAKNIHCKLKDNFIKVNLEIDGETKNVYFDLDENLIGESKKVELKTLPARALNYILQHYPYPKYNFYECIEFTDDKGFKNYYVAFEKNNQLITLKLDTKGRMSHFIVS
ncbi:MAG: hypothetical protein KGZ59_02665 [Chitinophagaceae bacterium]|nr:hypothetical protein [Chitinophagaceae bacterium]